MTAPKFHSEACHYCRRQRLKCGRSLPQCLKCTKKGQECLGYQRLFRWEQGGASRGKMAGMTFENMSKARARQGKSSLSASISNQQYSRRNTEVSLLGSLTNPLVQAVNIASRQYLFYCELLPSRSVPATHERSYFSC